MKTSVLISFILLATAIVGCATGPTRPVKYTARAELYIGAVEAFQEGDYATTILKYKKLAIDHRDPYAAEKLAIFYQWGSGVQQDYSQAKQWYDQAASRGNLGAKYYLSLVDLRGWPTQAQEIEWVRQDAKDGRIEAQHLLGNGYNFGIGNLPKSFSEAAKWWKRAAQNGDAEAQWNLSILYSKGEGVPLDFVRAYAWMNLSAANFLPSALRDLAVAHRDYNRRHLNPYELSQAQKLVRSFEEPQPQPDEPKALPRTEKELSYGSAFVVSRQGFLLTNEHVIEGCRNVELKLAHKVVTGKIVARDKSNDFALLEAPSATWATARFWFSYVATFRSGQRVRPGDSIMVIGFPLKGLLAEDPSVTTGVVSALAGPGNDTRLIQITAPVQPGNSGGPLLDNAGNVVGIVVSKLDALKVAAITGDIPQNVNFAIDSRLAQKFLDANGVAYETAQSKLQLPPADVAERGMNFTVPVECYRPG